MEVSNRVPPGHESPFQHERVQLVDRMQAAIRDVAEEERADGTALGDVVIVLFDRVTRDRIFPEIEDTAASVGLYMVSGVREGFKEFMDESFPPEADEWAPLNNPAREGYVWLVVATKGGASLMDFGEFLPDAPVNMLTPDSANN